MTSAQSEKTIKIRTKVLGYFHPGEPPADFGTVLKIASESAEDVSEADVRDVILRLLATHKLMYMPDMRITLGKRS